MRWDKRFLIGVPHIDREHQRLFQALNEVHSVFYHKGRCQDVDTQFTFFVEQVTAIFSAEEQCMYLHEFPMAKEHAREHQLFFQRLSLMHNEAMEQCTYFSRFSFILIANWLSSHILQSDSKFGDYTIDKNRYPTP
jgi:hemerythrin